MSSINIISSSKVKNGYKLCLDIGSSQVFYPDGKGGQLGDRGFIDGIPIISISGDGSPILASDIAPGMHEYSIDMDRREDVACQHTAEHLIAGIAHREFGLKNAGFRMSEEYSTIDLDGEGVSDEKVDTIEKIANKKIKEGLLVKDFSLPPEKVNELGKLRKEVSEKVSGDVRIIEVEDTDLCACGGFHVDRLSRLQLLKVTHTERVKGKYLRVYFKSGQRAIDDYSLKNRTTRGICQTLSCQNEEIEDRVNSLVENLNNIKTDLRALAMDFSELLAVKLENQAIEMDKTPLITYTDKKGEGEFLHKFIDMDKYTLLVEKNGIFSIFSNKISCKKFINRLRNSYEIKGGGSDSNGNVKGSISMDKIIENLKDF